MSPSLRILPFIALAFGLAGCGNSATVAPPDAGSPIDTPPAPPPPPAPPADVPASATDVPVQTAEHPTYWRDVAPLLNSRCSECHTAGGLAPFTVATYADVAPRAAMIAEQTTARRMPPWPPSRDCQSIQDPRTLTEAQIAMIQRWSDDGAPEGNHADYVAPPPATTRLPDRAGDLVVRNESVYTPTDAVDDYHCFVIDPHLTAERDLIGARIRPGDPSIVHHVILYEIKESALAELQRLDDAEPGPGYTCFGGPRVRDNNNIANPNQQFMVGWAPGSPPVRFPNNTGIRLSPNSRVVMQIHYNQLNGRGHHDQTSAELYLNPTPVSRVAHIIPIVQGNLNITAGDANASASVDFSLRRLGLPLSVTVFGSFPHMHMLGRQIGVDIVRSGDNAGRTDCLVNVPSWNFHWQQFYMYDEPVRIAPDDTVRLRCQYDNSPANQPVVNGVQQTPRTVHWGEGSLDEMCLNYVYITVP